MFGINDIIPPDKEMNAEPGLVHVNDLINGGLGANRRSCICYNDDKNVG
jgi:hypothetical protein